LVDVTVPCQTGRKIDGIRCRRCRYPNPEEIVTRGGVGRTPDGAVPDVRSDFEALVLPRLLSTGLPRPACNQTLQVGDERLTVDFLWEGRRLVVETDGAQTHATPVAFQRDRRRDQLLVAGGYRVARITWDQMKRELDEVVGRIAHGLELRVE
jgi:hypothetical protein